MKTATPARARARNPRNRKRQCRGGAVGYCSTRRIRARAHNPRRRPKIMTTVTKASTRTVRRINRRPLKVVLQATKPGMRRLRYMGGGKFSEKGKPMLFGSREAAQSAARILKDMYPAALRGWLLGFSS